MKYDIVTTDIKQIGDVFLFRVKRCSDGLVGGYIEDVDNLSEFGSCFVYDNAIIMGNAKVIDRAEVRDSSIICGDAIVKDNAMVSGKSVIQGKSIICDRAIAHDSFMTRNPTIDGDMLVSGSDCYETPSLIKNMFDDDILIYGDIFQIGLQAFDLNKILKSTSYFVKITKLMPEYKDCRVIFTQLIQQHKKQEAIYGKSNF